MSCLRIFNKLIGIKKIPLLNKLPSKRCYCEKRLDVNTNVSKDVILFKYDNPKYFKRMNIFGIVQFGLWTYLSVSAYKTLRDTPVDKSSDVAWWRKINLGESKYKNIMSVTSFIIGYGMLTVIWMYTLKSVRYLILRKGGKQLTIVTYSPFGENRMFTVGLENTCCKQARETATTQLPIKVKGHYLHYILDMKGEFKNPTLFDHTAGLQRRWAIR